jgi:transcription elongation GreA/GreB family factor
MEGGQAVSLEEQLRKDAESMREVGWFNRAKMYTAAADEIHRLEDRIKRLETALRRIANTDYRGNRSTESQIAFEALKP